MALMLQHQLSSNDVEIDVGNLCGPAVALVNDELRQQWTPLRKAWNDKRLNKSQSGRYYFAAICDQLPKVRFDPFLQQVDHTVKGVKVARINMSESCVNTHSEQRTGRHIPATHNSTDFVGFVPYKSMHQRAEKLAVGSEVQVGQ
jgi:hypothetical protein